jgi:hypothetical protein
MTGTHDWQTVPGADAPGYLQRPHVHHARDRLDGAGDLRGDLEAAGQLHFDLGFEPRVPFPSGMGSGSI